MNENDRILADLWREWFKTDAYPFCHGEDNLFWECIFCDEQGGYPNPIYDTHHKSDCIYVRAKAIIDQENQ